MHNPEFAPFPRDEYVARCNRARELMKEFKIDVLVLTGKENVVYYTGNHVFKTTDGGMSWTAISPDLTRGPAKGFHRVMGRSWSIDEMATISELSFLTALEERLAKVEEALGRRWLLREIDAPPPVICVLGDTSVFARPMVAVVGSRNASAAGLAFADRLQAAMTKAG